MGEVRMVFMAYSGKLEEQSVWPRPRKLQGELTTVTKHCVCPGNWIASTGKAWKAGSQFIHTEASSWWLLGWEGYKIPFLGLQGQDKPPPTKENPNISC
jgi:hypothetical protein